MTVKNDSPIILVIIYFHFVDLTIVECYHDGVIQRPKRSFFCPDGGLRHRPVFAVYMYVLILVAPFPLHNETVLGQIINEIARLHIEVGSLSVNISGQHSRVVVHVRKHGIVERH